MHRSAQGEPGNRHAGAPRIAAARPGAVAPLRIGLALLASLVLPACGPPSPPLVLVVVLDAASARYFGAWGDEGGATPEIDRLASEAVVFERASSQSPTTPPSTASLLTGVRVSTHQMIATSRLDERLQTLPALLARGGFRSYAVVANPLAGAPELGLDRGYHEAVLVYGKPSEAAPDETSKPKNRKEWLARRQPRRPLPTPEQVNEAVRALLPRLLEGPSFLYVHYLQPHEPYDPPERYLRLYGVPAEPGWSELAAARDEAHRTGVAPPGLVEILQARYRANLRHADDAFGELRRALEDEGLWDGAWVVLLSDHGEAFFGHGRFGHNTHLYEDMVHIPFLVRPPLAMSIPPRRLSHPVETIDLLPTLLDALGLPMPEQAEGDSLWPLIRGDAERIAGPEVITSTMAREQHAIRLGRWKYIRGPRSAEQLFDLEEDPDERDDVLERSRPHGEALASRLGSVVDAPAPAPPEPASPWQDPNLRSLLHQLGYTE